MKITKKAFVETLTGNKSLFFGTTRKLADEKVVKSAIDSLIADVNRGVKLEMRTCVAHSNFLEFSEVDSENSRLYLDTGVGTYHAYKCAGATVYARLATYYKEDEEDSQMAVYYVVFDN